MKSSKRAVFFDRDGTLIHDANYPSDPGQVIPIPESIPALKSLQEKGFLLVVISNQSGIGRGLITKEEARAVHQRFLQIFQENGITIDAAYYCPHAPEEKCSCRKPSPKMLEDAAEDMGIDLSRSFMIGDKLSDVQACKQAGCLAIFYHNTHSEFENDMTPDLVSQDWNFITKFILSSEA